MISDKLNETRGLHGLRFAYKRNQAVGLLSIALLTCAETAYAQTPIQVENITTRVPEEYRPVPIRVNAFEVTPFIELDVEQIDNVFALDGDGPNETLLEVTPGILIRDRRPDRQISAQAKVGYESYLNNTIDDRFRISGSATGRFGTGTQTRTFIGANIRRNGTQNGGFSDTGDIGRPISLTSYGANAGVERDIGQITATLEGRYRATNYGGDFIFADAILDAGIRDFEVFTGRGRAAYRLDSRQRIYLEAQYNDRSFGNFTDNTLLPEEFQENRSSNDFSIRAGYSRDFTNVLRLDANIGYLNRRFESQDASDTGSISFDGRLVWAPSKLTDIELRTARLVDVNNDPLTVGLLRTEVGGSIQHELRRNVVLAADARYSWLDVDNSDLFEDGTEVSVGTAVRYLVSRKWSLRLRAEYFDRSKFNPGSQTRVSIGTRYNF